ITSPIDAQRRREPPSTRMHCTRRAPELSATSRFDSAWIMIVTPKRRRGSLGRLDHHFPALAPGDGPAFADLHLVAHLEAVFLVVGRVLLRPGDVLLVQRVHDPPLDPDDHGLVHLVADHGALHDASRHGRASGRARRLGGENGLDPGDVAAHLAHPRGVLELPGGLLEAQVELLLLQLQQLLAQLVLGLGPEFRRLHCATSPGRPTKRVRSGSLAPPRRIASSASDAGTPSISNRIRPALTGATQYSTDPLPLPMRTSA